MSPENILKIILIVDMATSQKTDHVWESKEIVCWEPASGEPRPEMEFLEMLHYPDSPEPMK